MRPRLNLRRCFLVRLSRRFLVPATRFTGTAAQLLSRLAKGHRAAARSGLDSSEHGSILASWGASHTSGKRRLTKTDTLAKPAARL